ncbi:MAG: GntR family transcriptional regulator [Bacteroidales bacterium]|nr:GntR family transcriptional regulator [Bacteroidales bacterium]
MEFDNNRPIYLQIADAFCDRVLSGEIKAGDRIPSVREYGASIGVNPNTVARSYEKLTSMGVIYQQRGIGFFVAEDARKTILEDARERFFSEELPKFAERAKILGISAEELCKKIS